MYIDDDAYREGQRSWIWMCIDDDAYREGQRRYICMVGYALPDEN